MILVVLRQYNLLEFKYITITQEHKVLISRRIKEEFENGRDYYRYHGHSMLVLPGRLHQQPDPQFIDWHNREVFNG